MKHLEELHMPILNLHAPHCLSVRVFHSPPLPEVRTKEDRAFHKRSRDGGFGPIGPQHSRTE